jgi:predicted homoserine dehydrogenase-like protein
MWVQRVVLKHHRNVALARPPVGDVDIVEADRTAGDVLQAGDTAKGRRLATARRTDEDEELPVGDVEAHVLDRHDAFVARSELLS